MIYTPDMGWLLSFFHGIFEWSRLPAFLAFSFTACCWRQESIKEKCSRSVFSRIEPYSPALPRIKCKSGTTSWVFAWSYSQTWLATSCFNQYIPLYSILYLLFFFFCFYGCITILAFSSANGAFCFCSVCLSLSGLEYTCVLVLSWFLCLIRVSNQKGAER